jgi:hypothetical protein
MTSEILATLLALGATWYLWRKRRWAPGVATALAALAGLMNGLVIAANDGHMPVDMRGFRPFIPPSDHLHVVLTPQTHLKFLADVYGDDWARYSLGDIFCVLAVGVFLVAVISTLVRKS